MTGRHFETPEAAIAFMRAATDAIGPLLQALREAKIPCDRVTAGALLMICATGYRNDRDNFVATGLALYHDTRHAKATHPGRVTKGGRT